LGRKNIKDVTISPFGTGVSTSMNVANKVKEDLGFTLENDCNGYGQRDTTRSHTSPTSF